MNYYTQFMKIFLAVFIFTAIGATIVKAQVTVTVDVPTNTTPNLAASYTSLANALTAVNAVTAMSGPITLTCAAGSETAPATGLTIGSASLNAVLNAAASNMITITASGSVTINAGVGTATPTSAAPDGIIKLSGADWVTIDGLTFTDGNVTNPATMEYGIGLFKLSASDGSRNNTIKNCTINMQRINNATATTPMIEGAVGILIINSTPTTATTSITPTVAAGSNSNNKIYTNSINGGNYGIGLSGFAASAGVGPSPNASTFLGDLSNDIGGSSALTGNTILNYGGGAATNPAAGIRANNQWSINISYNTINNNNGGGVNHATTLRGIYAQAGTSANATITFNTVTVKSAATTSACTAIENAIGSTAASNTININNNTVSGCTYVSATTGTFSAILSTATAATVNMNTNTVNNNSIGTALTNSSCVFQGIYSSGAATNFIANSNTVTNNSLLNNGGALYSIRGGTSLLTWNSNIINNNSIPNNAGTLSASLYGLYNISSPTQENFANNLINNLSVTGSSTSTATVISGIHVNTAASSTKNITGNTIHSLTFTNSSTGSATVNGITQSLGSTINISKNKIYDLTAQGTASIINGINISSGTTVNIFNNYIGNLTTPSATGLIAIRGLNFPSTGTTTSNVSYNTVYLNATSSSVTTFGTSCIQFSSTATNVLNLRNNVLVNLSTPAQEGSNVATNGVAACIMRTSGTAAVVPSNYATTSNNNAFWCNPTAGTNNHLTYTEGTTTVTNPMNTFANMKTFMVNRDQASVTENPTFVSTTGSSANFLHINTGIATQIESSAAPIGTITDDFDGDIRNVTNPDIGADEFAGIPADITGPAITYTVLNNSACTTGPTFTATITDASLVNTTAGTKPRLYYKKSTDANTYVGNTNADNGWKYVEATNASSPFSFTFDYSLLQAAVVAGDNIQYFVIAEDLAGTPNVGINSGTFAATPATVALTIAEFPIGGSINNFTILTTIATSVTIGAAETYPTLTGTGGLFEAINNNALGGNTVATIVDAAITEPATVVLNQIAYGCATYTLTIKPQTTSTLTGTIGTGAVIKLNGADNVIIDGSNSGGSDRSLTIQNTTAVTSGNAVIWLASPASGNGATNNIIKNCIIEGNTLTTSFTGLHIGGNATITLTAAGTERNSNNTIQNNLFRKTQYGLSMFGFSAASPDLNNIVTQNNFGTSTVGEGHGLIAINADRQQNLVISNNEIQGVTSSTTTSTFGGMRLLDFKDGQCYNNKIHDLSYTGTSTPKLYGIIITSASYTTSGNPSNALVYNNAIYKLNSSSTSAVWNTTGILASAGYGDKFYFNTVHLTGQVNNSSSGLSAAFANGDDNITSVCSNIDVRNNIFSFAGTSLGGNVWAYYTRATSFTGSVSNYNVLRCVGTGATNNTARFNATNYTTLAAWQAAASQDANSIESDPLINSATNLQVATGSPALLAGVAGTGVTTDILSVARGGAPTIGAYETAIDLLGPTISYTALGITCSTADRTLTPVTITDGSGVNTTAGNKPRIYYKKSTDANTFAGNTNADNGWKYTEATNASSPFSFTTDYSLLQSAVVLGDVIQYFIVAEDLAGTPNVSINNGIFAATPASVDLTAAAFAITGTIRSYTINLDLAGNYNVGSAEAPPFNTITAAIAAYSTACLSSAVTFDLTDATYPSETFPIVIGTNSFASATNTLTIKPASGNTALISGSSTTAIFDINNGDYIIIDGSNNGSSTKDLTVSNTNTSGSVIRLINDATNNIVKNCLLTGVSTSTTNGIVFISTTTGTTGNDNNTIEDNSISKGATVPAMGILNSGTTTSTTLKNSGLVISGNKVFDFSNTGIRDNAGSVGTVYSGNEIYQTSARTTVLTGFRPSATSIEGFTFTNNNIHDLTTSSTGATYGIHLFDIQNATTGIVSNNFINLSNTASLTLKGIYDQSALGELFSIYYNTVVIDGVVTGLSNSEAYSWEIASTSDVKNNIFVNKRTGGTGKHYAIRTNTTLANITSDYNDIYSSGGTANVFGFDGTADRADLSAWQTNTSKDANSIAEQPYFTSASDLHLLTGSNCGIDAKGTPIAVTVDYDGDTRDVTTPDIGADEFTSTFSVSAGSDQSISCNATTLAGSAVPTGGTGTWTVVSGSANIASPNSATSAVTGLGIGVNTLRWTVTAGSCGPTFDEVDITAASDDAVWIGGTSTSWTNSANWCGGVPIATVDVVIPNGATFYPDITSGSQVGQTMSIANLASVTISGGSLTIGGDIADAGTLTVGTSGTLDMASNQVTGTGTVVINGTVNTTKAVGFSGSASTTIMNTITTLTLGSASTVDYASSGSQTITAGNYANLSNSGNGGRTLESTGTIGISAVLSPGTGNYTIGTSTVEFNGSSAQSIPTLPVASGANYYNLTLNNSNGATLAANVDLMGALTLTSGAFDVNGNTLTLLSSATQTARIAPVTGGSFVGDLTMQRFVPGGNAGWATIGMPVTGSTLAAWNDDIVTSGYNGSTAGTGTFISVYNYDETDLGLASSTTSYIAATDASNSVDPKKGYFVFVADNATTVSDKLIDVTGPPLIGTQNMNVTFSSTGNVAEDGWNLISNPYCSAIDWLAPTWTKTNMDDAIYIYDTDVPQYKGSVGGVSYNGGNELIASSQSFFVHANAASPSLSAVETVKTANSPTFYRSSNASEAGVLRLQLDGLNGTYTDETVFRTKTGATSNFDGAYDAYKLYSFDPAAPNISSKMNGIEYVVNAVADLTNNLDLPIRVNVNTPGSYTINFKGLQNFTSIPCFTFEDLLTNTSIDLSNDSTYTFTSVVDTASASPRFVLHFGVETIVPSMAPSATTLSYPGNTTVSFTNNSAGATTYSWNFGDGSPLETVSSPSHTYTAPGTYIVTLTARNTAGCSETTNVVITVENVTSVINLVNNENITIGKDAQGVFANYNFAGKTKVKVNIFNTLGEQVGETQTASVQNAGRLAIKTPEVAKGVYTIELLFDNKKITRKLDL